MLLDADPQNNSINWLKYKLNIMISYDSIHNTSKGHPMPTITSATWSRVTFGSHP